MVAVLYRDRHPIVSFRLRLRAARNLTSRFETFMLPFEGTKKVLCVALFALGSFISPEASQAQLFFSRHTVDAGFAGAIAVQAVDIDGDLDLDMIGAGMVNGNISWWENTDGTGKSWEIRSVSDTFTGARFINAVDIDGDGDLDLFGAAASLDAITWWENMDGSATEWAQHDIDTSFDFAMHVFAADVDGDEDIDLMGAALKGDMITWWENTEGDGSAWERKTIDDDFDGARHVCAIDMDQDGDMDLLGSASIANKIIWWENIDGTSTSWLPHVVDTDFAGVNTVKPVDIDMDGDPDLLATADVADKVAWWENTGGAMTWNRHVIDDSFNGAFSTAAIDMDGDGDMDVIGAAAEADMVSWWENITGVGTVWEKHTVDGFFDFPMFVEAADIDDDGDVDVIGGNFNGDVVWWESETSLPVELTTFDAVLNGSTIQLRWETASEKNNAGFEVQHLSARADNEPGMSWKAVSFVEGAGTAAEGRPYRFSIDKPSPGMHRFRLKQVDFDGAFEYSPIIEVVVTGGGRGKLTDVYPNPFNPNTRVYLTVSSSQQVAIDVYNTLGQHVARLHDGNLSADESHAFNFEADGLPGGIYLIRATGENFVDTRQALLVK